MHKTALNIQLVYNFATVSQNIASLYRLNPLHNHGTGSASTVTYRGNAIFTRLELVKECDENSGA